jgi:hypothetical protein
VLMSWLLSAQKWLPTEGLNKKTELSIVKCKSPGRRLSGDVLL